jgi:hypothetical protein
MKTTIRPPVPRRRKFTRFSRAKLERSFAKFRADLAGTTPPADLAAIQIGRDVLPPSDRD